MKIEEGTSSYLTVVKFIFFVSIAVIFAVLFLTSEQELKLKQRQVEFCKIISIYREMYDSEEDKDFYIDQESRLKEILLKRAAELKALLGNGKITHWQGKITNITVSEGKGAYLEVRLPRQCYSSLESTGNFIIPIDSTLYQDLRGYRENSEIIFSGNFILPPNESAANSSPYDHAYYGENSITESGNMAEPEFMFKFAYFHKEKIQEQPQTTQSTKEETWQQEDKVTGPGLNNISPEECKKDIDCWGDKYLFSATIKCAELLENLAEYSYKWTDKWYETKFNRHGWYDEEKGLIKYGGDKIQYQNGFGAWQNYKYVCTYDPDNDKVIDVAVEQGRF